MKIGAGLIAVCLAWNAAAAQQRPADCVSTPDLSALYNAGWGNGLHNNRQQPYSNIDLANVGSLELAWVFALDENPAPHSYPVITADTLFIGTPDGNLYALDRFSGCQRWRMSVDEPIRSGITYGRVDTPEGIRHLLFFGTFQGNVFAVDAGTGELVWQADVKDHAWAMVTGTPSYHDGRLYVPISSGEVALAANPFYGCCTFRGALRALNAATGALLWNTHVIDEEPQVTGRHYLFVEEYGPSGAPVWSSPTLDPENRRVYVGTGENYTRPATSRSDSIVAFDMDTGTILWHQQYTAEDAFNMACGLPIKANCPENSGPDLDFGAPPILSETEDGTPILLAGQKSGGVYGIDPATGERRWQQYFGRGGMLGGVHWGMAVNQQQNLLIAPISDIPTGKRNDREADPGLHALDISTGKPRWSTPHAANCEGREQCRGGLSAAITATDQLVFAAGLDGSLMAYDLETGNIVWSYDSWREFESVNGLPANGGAIDVHGPALAGDYLYVQSGYGTFGQKGGNALLAFRINPGSEPGAARE